MFHLKLFVKNWRQHEIPSLAAALAYYTAFSIAPLLLMIIAIAGLAFGQEAVRGQILGQLEGIVGRPSAEVIQQMIASAWKPDKNMGAILLSLIAIVLGAMGVLSQLKKGLNRIWQATEENAGVGGLVKERAKFLGFIIGIGFVLMVSLAVSAFLALIGKEFGNLLPFPEFIGHLLDFVISTGVIMTLFAMIFKYITDADLPWKQVWVGALITAVLFSIGKFVIGLYLGKGAVGSSYGTAGGVLIILLWVYYSGIILYTGAELTKTYFYSRSSSHGRR